MEEENNECAGATNLVVNEKDRITLSYNVNQFKPNYTTLTPRTIDEVKQAIGVPKEVPLNRPLCCDSPLKTSIKSIDQLADPQQSKTVIQNVRFAALEYVKGDYKNVAQWTGVINKWLAQAQATIHVVTFEDIVILNGGVLHVSKDTHVLTANSIKLYGNGLIEAESDLTIDCTTIEGNLIFASAVSELVSTVNLKG